MLALTMLYLLYGIGLATRAWAGSASEAELRDFVAAADTIDALTLLFQVLAAIGVLAWIHRAVRNTPALGGGIPRWTPAKSAAWWCVPLANLVLPWTIVRDLWRRTSPQGAAADTGLVGAWWLLYVGGNFATSLASSGAAVADSVEAARAAMALTAATVGCTAISGVLLIWIIGHLESWADARAAGVAAMQAQWASPTAERRP